jgi:endonuclease V-like protein UPF0215 family
MLKREIRILGLSASINKLDRVFIGVVFRGNLWLDGALACRLKSSQRDPVSKLGNAIMKSKQYSQIKAVILARDDLLQGKDANIRSLARKIKLPVIAMVRRRAPRSEARFRKGKNRRTLHYTLKVSGKTVAVEVFGMNRETVTELFRVACAPNRSIPEAVRVAELVARHTSNAFSNTESSKA